MGRKRKKYLEVPLDIEAYETAQSAVEGWLNNVSISKQIMLENLLVFETIIDVIRLQGFAPETVLAISGENRLGDLSLRIGFEGKRFIVPDQEEGEPSPELKILEGFADKISYSYHSGYNTIRLSVRKNPNAYLINCGVGLLLALVAYVPISLLLSSELQDGLLQHIVLPLEKLFGNAMLLVGTPVTLFSMMKNTSDTFIVAERSSSARRMQWFSIGTSILAILLALFIGLFVVYTSLIPAGVMSSVEFKTGNWDFAGFESSIIPSNIGEVFSSGSPIPLILLALLMTYALCSAGKYFDMLKGAIDACYMLFSRMLRVIMATLPAFCFLAFLDVLLGDGFVGLLVVAAFVVVLLMGTLVLYASYAIRLRARGVRVGEFWREFKELFKENFAIGSVIEATPYNIRYCAKHVGMNRRVLEDRLPVLAQINLDGNCFILMMTAVLMIALSGYEVSFLNLVVIAILILFLSFGSPNQPGSILIGSIFIITYLNSYDFICMAIYLEVFMGSVQNITNVISDIVMVAVEVPSKLKKATE